jgi:hypothetical protein
MLTRFIDNNNFFLCDSVPTQSLIGTFYKVSVANEVQALNYTFVDYDCGTVRMRPPQIYPNSSKTMGGNECGTVGAAMPTKLKDCSLDKSLQYNTCCYLKSTYQGYQFISCIAHVSKDPLKENYKAIVTKAIARIGITVNDYVCACSYLSFSYMLLIILKFLF